MDTSINQFTFNTEQYLWENYGIAVNEPLLITSDGRLVCETPVSKIVRIEWNNIAIKGDKVIAVFRNEADAVITLLNAGWTIGKVPGMPIKKAVYKTRRKRRAK